MAQTPRKSEGRFPGSEICLTSPVLAPFTPGADASQDKVRSGLPREQGCRAHGLA